MQSKILTAFCLCFLSISSAMAADISFNGFATVAMGYDIEDENEDTTTPASPYSERTVDNLQESKVALQWTAQIEKDIRFVGQTMARGDASTGFTMQYDWAYFDFNVGDSGKFKAGRLRIPFYKYSDYLDVGYAYHWITPPESMYSLSFSNIDGLGYQVNFEGMGMEHSLNTVLGAYQGDLPLGGVPTASKLENFFAINWSASMGDHEFYAAYAQADVYIPAAAAVGLAAANTALGGDSSDVLVDGDYGHFFGLGYKATFGDVGVFAEYSQVGIEDSVLSDSSGGYIGGSYTMNDYTYHLTFESSKSDEKTYTNGDNDLGDGTSLNSLVSSALGNGGSTTVTIGARKDIGTSTAVKLDLSMYTEDRIQTAALTASKEERKATTLKFAIETMF